MCLVIHVAASASAFLHLRLEDMPLTLLKFRPDFPIVLAKDRPVVVVEIFHDLECPSAVHDIAAHHLGLRPVRNRLVPDGQQLVAGLTEQQIRVP